jgi:hypothetical protein
MLLEAVTVSVGYGDFLGAVAPWNRPLLDRWLVATSPDDAVTRHICKKYDMECLLSEDYKREGQKFAKGAMINRALQHLRGEGWRLHVDADIAIPSHLRRSLNAANLDEKVIYGCDRVMCPNWETWKKVLESGYMQTQHDLHWRLNWPQGLAVGTRFSKIIEGYVPIGFFQLWHSGEDEWNGIQVKPYPINHGTGCRTDVQHALQWDRRFRALLPEVIVIHLESEQGGMGQNWNGRTTKRFGPEPSLKPVMKPGTGRTCGS